MVYVLNKHGKPLMPTDRYGHVRKLLKSGKAVPVCNNPFTIRLKYDTPDIVQSLTCGIDVGRENIGLAVSNEQGECIFLCNVQTNNKQVTKNMKSRAEYRRTRRNHRRQKKQRKSFRTKTTIQNGESDFCRNKKACFSKKVRYPGMEESITHKVIQGKEAKFNNRRRPEGWIAPSARNLVQIHINVVKRLMGFLPISGIVIEHNVFNFQKLENADIKAWEYQKGPLYGFKDYKDYIYKQQNGICLLCSKKHIEQYHHIMPQSKNGSNSMSNIAGLCNECHDLVHKDDSRITELGSLKSGMKKKYEIGLLNSCIHVIIEEMNKLLPTICCSGYETSEIRKRLKLDKDHCLDAYCISLYNKTTKTPAIKSEVYKMKHFKKKSNNIILKYGSRQYFYNGKLVATNRSKATEQKTLSLEEYMSAYRETHNQKKTDKHFHELEIKPAKRIYTFHKKGIVQKFKCGDVVKYYKKIGNKEKSFVFVAEVIKQHKETIEHSATKSAMMKFCQSKQRQSLVFVE